PVRDLSRRHPRAISDAEREEKLHPAESDARIGRVSDDDRAGCASDAEPDQKHRKNDGERIRRCAEEKRQQTGPDTLGAKRSESRKRDSDINGRRAVIDRPYRSIVGAVYDRPTRAFREQKTRARDDRVERDRRQGRSGKVIFAQQVKAGSQATDRRAEDVAAIEEPEPRNA